MEILHSDRFEKPRRSSEWVRVYTPQPDVYRGEDTASFKKGTIYPEWIVNDFTLLKSPGRFDLWGITHPRPQGFKDAFNFSPLDVHEAEYQLFHAAAEGETFGDVFYEDSFEERPKVLYPADRPGEKPEIWAPCAIRRGDEYVMIYSPKSIRYALSCDAENWESGHVLFESDDPTTRDPFYFTDDDGEEYLLTCEGNRVVIRSADGLSKTGEGHTLQTNPFRDGSSESPFLFKRHGVYYLAWSIYDGQNGCYDERNFVFASKTLDGFEGRAPITMLDGHAPEFVVTEEGSYILSVYYPSNGVSAAKLIWE